MMGGATTILLYHCVNDRPSSALAPFTVSPGDFARHMQLVAESGRRALTAGEYSSHRGVRDAVVVTFDDGFADFATTALPVLQRFEIPATLFVTTGWMEDADAMLRGCGPADRMLRMADLPGLAANGVEIGAHSVTHPQMDTLDQHGARLELLASKDLLEQTLGRPVTTFAYPHGFQSPRLRRQVAQAGYVAGYGVGNALADERSSQMNLPRLMLGPQQTPSDVQRWLRGEAAMLGERDRWLTRGYRAVRRSRALLTGRPGSNWT